jgi:hypothetical protein
MDYSNQSYNYFNQYDYDLNFIELKQLYPEYSDTLIHAFNSLYFDISLTREEDRAYEQFLANSED